MSFSLPFSIKTQVQKHINVLQHDADPVAGLFELAAHDGDFATALIEGIQDDDVCNKPEMEYVLTPDDRKDAVWRAVLAVRAAAAGHEEDGLARPGLLASIAEELSATGSAPSDFHKLVEYRLAVLEYALRLDLILRSTKDVARLTMDVPRPAMPVSGMRVVRGPNWCWKDEDGKKGNLGTIKTVAPKAPVPQPGGEGAAEQGPACIVRVQWDGSASMSDVAYRWNVVVPPLSDEASDEDKAKHRKEGGTGRKFDLQVVAMPMAYTTVLARCTGSMALARYSSELNTDAEPVSRQALFKQLLKLQPNPVHHGTLQCQAFRDTIPVAEKIGGMSMDTIADVLLGESHGSPKAIEAMAEAMHAQANAVSMHAKAVVSAYGRGNRRGKPSKSDRRSINRAKDKARELLAKASSINDAEQGPGGAATAGIMLPGGRLPVTREDLGTAAKQLRGLSWSLAHAAFLRIEKALRDVKRDGAADAAAAKKPVTAPGPGPADEDLYQMVRALGPDPSAELSAEAFGDGLKRDQGYLINGALERAVLNAMRMVIGAAAETLRGTEAQRSIAKAAGIVNAAKRAQIKAKQDIAQARAAREQAEQEGDASPRRGRSSSTDSEGSAMSEPENVDAFMRRATGAAAGGSASDGSDAPPSAAVAAGGATPASTGGTSLSHSGGEDQERLDRQIRDFRLGSRGAQAAEAVALAELAVARFMARKQKKGKKASAGPSAGGAASGAAGVEAEDPILARLEEVAKEAVDRAEKAEALAAPESIRGSHGFTRVAQDKGINSLAVMAAAVLRASSVAVEATVEQIRQLLAEAKRRGGDAVDSEIEHKFGLISNALWDGVCGRLCMPLVLSLLPFASNLPVAILLLPSLVRLTKAVSEAVQVLPAARQSAKAREQHEQRVLRSSAADEMAGGSGGGQGGEHYETPPPAEPQHSPLFSGNWNADPPADIEGGMRARNRFVVATMLSRPSNEAGGAPGRTHWLVDLQHTLVLLSSRMTATSVAGVPEGRVEHAAQPWLQSGILSGGAALRSLESLRADAARSAHGTDTGGGTALSEAAAKMATTADELSWDNEMFSIAAGEAGAAAGSGSEGREPADPSVASANRSAALLAEDLTQTVRWQAALCVGEDSAQYPVSDQEALTAMKAADPRVNGAARPAADAESSSASGSAADDAESRVDGLSVVQLQRVASDGGVADAARHLSDGVELDVAAEIEGCLWDVAMNRQFSPSAEVLETIAEACAAAAESCEDEGEKARLQAMSDVASSAIDPATEGSLSSSTVGKAVVHQVRKMTGYRYKLPEGVRPRDAARVLAALCKHSGLGVEVYVRCTAATMQSAPSSEATKAAEKLVSLPLGSRMTVAWQQTREYCRFAERLVTFDSSDFFQQALSTMPEDQGLGVSKWPWHSEANSIVRRSAESAQRRANELAAEHLAARRGGGSSESKEAEGGAEGESKEAEEPIVAGEIAPAGMAREASEASEEAEAQMTAAGGRRFYRGRDGMDVVTSWKEARVQLGRRALFILAMAPAQRVARYPVQQPREALALEKLLAGDEARSGDGSGGEAPAGSLAPLSMSRWRSALERGEGSGAGFGGAAGSDLELPGGEAGSLAEAVSRGLPQDGDSTKLLMANAILYIMHGDRYPPRVLLTVMRARHARAAQRRYGLRAALALLKVAPQAVCRREVLAQLRPALRTKVSWGSGHAGPVSATGSVAASQSHAAATSANGGPSSGAGSGGGAPPSAADSSPGFDPFTGAAVPSVGVADAPAVAEMASVDLKEETEEARRLSVTVRHHALKGLEGVDTSARRAVFSAFVEVGVLVSELQAASEENGEVLLSHACQWLLGTDHQASEHEFILRTGILPRLYASFSIVPGPLLLHGAGGSPAASGRGARQSQWSAWSEDFVRRAMASGTLSRWELLAHVASAGAPPGDANKAWFEDTGLPGTEAGALARSLSEAQAIALYREAARRWEAAGQAPTGSSVVGHAGSMSAPPMARLASTDAPGGVAGPASPDAVVRANLRSSSWSLFKRITVGAVGVRRRDGFDWMQSVVACHGPAIARDALQLACLPSPVEASAGGGTGVAPAIKPVDPNAVAAVVNLSHIHRDAQPASATAAWFAAHADRARQLVAGDLSAGEGDQADRPAITQGPAAGSVSSSGKAIDTAQRIRHTVWLWRRALACLASETISALAVVAASAAEGLPAGSDPLAVAAGVLGGGGTGPAASTAAARAAGLLDSVTPAAAEDALYRSLALFASTRTVPAVTSALQQPAMLRLLALATRFGSLRVQRTSLRLWTSLLGAVDLSVADACVQDALKCTPQASAVLQDSASSGPGQLTARWLALIVGSTSPVAHARQQMGVDGKPHAREDKPEAAATARFLTVGGLVVPRLRGAGHHITDMAEEAVSALRRMLRWAETAAVLARQASIDDDAAAGGASPTLSRSNSIQAGECGPMWSDAICVVLRAAFSTDAVAAAKAAQDEQAALAIQADDTAATLAASGGDAKALQLKADGKDGGVGTAGSANTPASHAHALCMLQSALAVLEGHIPVLRVGGLVCTSEQRAKAGSHAELSALRERHAALVVDYDPMAQPSHQPGVRIVEDSGRGDGPGGHVQADSLVAADTLTPLGPAPAPASALRNVLGASSDGSSPMEVLRQVLEVAASLRVSPPAEDDDELRGREQEESKQEVSAQATGLSRCEVLDSSSAVVQIAATGLRSLEVAVAVQEVAMEAVRAGVLATIQGLAEQVVDRRRVLSLDLALLRSVHLRERMLEWDAGLIFGAAWQAVKSEKELSPAEQERKVQAEGIAGMLGMSVELAVRALKVNNDDANAAVNWLMEGHGEALESGGGLTEGPQGRTDSDKRLKLAMELAQNFGKPPLIVIRALEMFGDDQNRAMEWLMDKGDRYIPGLSVPDVPAAMQTGRGAAGTSQIPKRFLQVAGVVPKASSGEEDEAEAGDAGTSGASDQIDDSAAVEDLDVGQVEPMVQECDPRRVGSLLGAPAGSGGAGAASAARGPGLGGGSGDGDSSSAVRRMRVAYRTTARDVSSFSDLSARVQLQTMDRMVTAVLDGQVDHSEILDLINTAIRTSRGSSPSQVMERVYDSLAELTDAYGQELPEFEHFMEEGPEAFAQINGLEDLDEAGGDYSGLHSYSDIDAQLRGYDQSSRYGRPAARGAPSSSSAAGTLHLGQAVSSKRGKNRRNARRQSKPTREGAAPRMQLAIGGAVLLARGPVADAAATVLGGSALSSGTTDGAATGGQSGTGPGVSQGVGIPFAIGVRALAPELEGGTSSTGSRPAGRMIGVDDFGRFNRQLAQAQVLERLVEAGLEADEGQLRTEIDAHNKKYENTRLARLEKHRERLRRRRRGRRGAGAGLGAGDAGGKSKSAEPAVVLGPGEEDEDASWLVRVPVAKAAEFASSLCGPLHIVSAVENGADDDEYARAEETGVLVRLGTGAEAASGATPSAIVCLDTERSLPRVVLCRVGQLRAHSHTFAYPVTSSGDARTVAAAADLAVAVLTARRAFASMLVSWPTQLPHPLGQGAGSDLAMRPAEGKSTSQASTHDDDTAIAAAQVVARSSFLRVLKLTAAAEDAVAGTGKIPTGQGLGIGSDGALTLPRGVPAISALQLLLRRCLASETSRMEQGLEDDPAVASGAAAAASGAGSRADASPLFSRSLVAEVSRNILSATRVGGAPSAERKMRESLHPHIPSGNAFDTITCPGARALWITFDPRCSLSGGTVLRFRGGSKKSGATTGQFTGEGEAWRPFVVHGDTVNVEFAAQAREHCGWGYRFWVAPMHGLQWENEAEAPEEGSLEWALFVLELLLKDASSLVERGALHDTEVFGAMVQYLRARGSPFKHRIVALLTQLLKDVRLFKQEGGPDLEPLRGIERAVLQHCCNLLKERGRGGNSALPPQLLQLVELLITARTAERSIRAAQRRERRERAAREQGPASGAGGDGVGMGPPAVGTKSTSVASVDAAGVVDPQGEGLIFPPPEVPSAAETQQLQAELERLQQAAQQRQRELQQRQQQRGRRRLGVPRDPADQDLQRATPQSLSTALVDVMDMCESVFLKKRLPDQVLWHVALDSGWVKDPCEITPDVLSELCRDLLGWGTDADEELVQWVTTITSPARRARVASAKEAAKKEGGKKEKGEGAEAGLKSVSDSGAGDATDASDLQAAAVEMASDTDDAFAFQKVAAAPIRSTRARLSLLQLMNRRLRLVMPLVDVVHATDEFSLGYKLRSLSHCIFLECKQGVLWSAVEQTEGRSSGKEINLDNNVAGQATDAAQRDPSARQVGTYRGVFPQAYEELKGIGAAAWRAPAGTDSGSKLFRVSFRGESGIDAGGLFRDCVQRIVEDAFSEHFALLRNVPNGVTKVGDNMDKRVPDPTIVRRSTDAQCMLEFLGRMMGFSLRWKHYLPYDWAPLVWKLLLEAKPDASDLMAIDRQAHARLERIRQCPSQEKWESEFPGQTFTFPDCTGKERELFSGQGHRQVRFEERHMFADKALEMRLSEFNVGVAAVRKGLQVCVPARTLKLFTWRELEQLCCGDPLVDAAYLRQHTHYSDGYSEEHPVIQRFWRVFDSLPNKDRSDFVRFSWGRARLPRPEHFTTPFSIHGMGGGDSALPMAHTCFFQVDLPQYSSDEIMRQRIVAVCKYGLGGEFLNA